MYDTRDLDEDINRLNQIDRNGVITEEDRKRFPGIHFCPDFDYMVVADICHESELCTCNEHRTDEF